MAVDALLLSVIRLNAAHFVLRLYQWPGLAVTVGRFQDAQRTVDLGLCRAFDIPVARRATGGRGVLHGNDLTVALAFNLNAFNLDEQVSVKAAYTRIIELFTSALKDAGVEAIQGRDHAGTEAFRRKGGGDCFLSTTSADVVERATGAKIIGGALRLQGDHGLFQCSIPLLPATIEAHVFRSRLFRSVCGPTHDRNSTDHNSYGDVRQKLDVAILVQSLSHAVAGLIGQPPITIHLNQADVLGMLDAGWYDYYHVNSEGNSSALIVFYPGSLV